jgi:hypothetical protein
MGRDQSSGINMISLLLTMACFYPLGATVTPILAKQQKNHGY